MNSNISKITWTSIIYCYTICCSTRSNCCKIRYCPCITCCTGYNCNRISHTILTTRNYLGSSNCSRSNWNWINGEGFIWRSSSNSTNIFSINCDISSSLVLCEINSNCICILSRYNCYSCWNCPVIYSSACNSWNSINNSSLTLTNSSRSSNYTSSTRNITTSSTTYVNVIN